MHTRRKFVKESCTACLAILAGSSIASLLSSCSSLSVFTTSIENNVLKVPKDNILPEETMKIIRSKSLGYDVLLILGLNKTHKAFLMRCTHQDNILVANKNGLSCNLHGTQYDLNGMVTRGPASKPLELLKVSEENNLILINLK
ncbi:MAG TPA: Rieske (2Fe-2S) protein [Bacteroidia bacterium]|nr:Rieske (2Fe-2S) protein [Bacteroidia bacterium]HNS12589.1 Rieske (2Fe-2S) protein [Bacteroidia bacterium]